jgi:hypothetical protein
MVKDGKAYDAVRRYRNPNRHDNAFAYRSVTYVTGALPKMALLNWYASTTARAAVLEHDAWTNMLGDEKQTAEDRQIKWLSMAPARARDGAASFGTGVHGVVEKLLQGETYEVEALAEPWVAAAQQFVVDLRPKLERLETSVYDERTMCAGTFDFLGTLGRAPELGRCLIDWKTSKGVYPDYAVQLVGGYLFGSEYIVDDDGKEREWVEPDSCLVVQFTAHGYNVHPIPKDRVYRRAFLGALEIRKWEEDGPNISQTYQLKLDLPPSEDELAYFRRNFQELSVDQQMELQKVCNELGVKTSVRKGMTVHDFDRAWSLLCEIKREQDNGKTREN